MDEQADVLHHRDAMRNENQDARWTYLEVKEHVDAVACGLLEYRIVPGQTFLTSLPNDTESFLSMYAAAKGRSIMCPVAPSSSVEELRNALKVTNARGWFLAYKHDGKNMLKQGYEVIPELQDLVVGEPPRSHEFRNFTTVPVHTGEHNNSFGYLKYRDFPVYGPMPSPLPSLAKDIVASDPVLGTIHNGSHLHRHTHSSMVNNASFLAQHLGLARDVRMFIATEPQSSITHVGSLASFVSGAFQASRGIQNTSDAQIAEVLRELEREVVTVVLASTSVAKAIASHPHTPKHKYKVEKVAVVSEGNEAGADEALAQLQAALGASRGSLVISSPAACGAVAIDGAPLPHSELKIVSGGKVAEDGVTGTLAVKGHQTYGGEWVDTGIAASIEGGKVQLRS